jgi:GH24 family phage-related lysozyme (muramidase)
MAITSPPACGLELIKEFEGLSLKAYPDPASGGKPYTIGYGSTYDLNHKPFYPGDTCSTAQANDYLNCACAHDFLPGLYPIPYYGEMNDEMVGALLSFGYNLGAGFYGSPGFDTITKRLKNKEWELVPDALLLYINPGTSVSAGLKRRRIAEGDLWNSGLFELNVGAPVGISYIQAIQDTYLKKRPTQSSSLNNSEKCFVPKGKQYKVISAVRDVDQHTYVTLDYSAGAWYIYDPHWILY